jgi:hypothetical protein
MRKLVAFMVLLAASACQADPRYGEAAVRTAQVLERLAALAERAECKSTCQDECSCKYDDADCKRMCTSKCKSECAAKQ